MEKFIFLEDEATADVAFIAKGKNKAEIIGNACLALIEVMTDLNSIEEKLEYYKEFEAEDLFGLVYDVLNFILYLFDTEDILFKSIKIDLDEKANSLLLKGYGERFNTVKHQIKTHIKAVTFFGMLFDENGLKVTLDL
jgi:SHS2 domain-containing protein